MQAVEGKLQGASLRCTQTGPGQAYLLRKKTDLTVKDWLNGMVAQITEKVFQRLLAHAVKGVKTKIWQLGQKEEKEEMVLNAVFLVPKSNVSIFRARVKDGEEKCRRHGITLRVTGPWPPYNFCPVFTDEITRW